MAGCLQPGAQYTQKPGLFSPSKPQQGEDSRQVDDLGLDLSKQGKRWFPFSDGPRNCVGQALAKMNMAATFAQLYSHYSFKLAEEVTCLSMPGYTASWLLLFALYSDCTPTGSFLSRFLQVSAVFVGLCVACVLSVSWTGAAKMTTASRAGHTARVSLQLCICVIKQQHH